MNTLMLFSGGDKAFEEAGYLYPKNLAEIAGRPLIQHVVECFQEILDTSDHVIFVIRKQEAEHFHTALTAKLLYPRAEILLVPAVTRGAACTALLAAGQIENEEELLIINGDILIEGSLGSITANLHDAQVDGGVVTFESVHPRWSYVKCDEQGYVMEAAEKRPISRHATTGMYYYRQGRDFVEAAKESIRKDAQTNGCFYICPVFNEMILRQKKIAVYEIRGERYHSLSDPKGVEKYQKYLENGGAVYENRKSGEDGEGMVCR